MTLLITFILISILLGPLVSAILVGTVALGIALTKAIQDIRGKGLSKPKKFPWLDRDAKEKNERKAG